MNIQGSDSLFRLPSLAAPTAPRQPESPARSVAMPAVAPAPAAATPPRAAEAPRGATLWELLTEDERTFFAAQTALGPITYRPGARTREAHSAAPTGQRIDVKG